MIVCFFEPVKEIVSRHHSEEAGRVSDRVQLVVELLKLLVEQIARLALGFTAGARSAKEKQQNASSHLCLYSRHGFLTTLIIYTATQMEV